MKTLEAQDAAKPRLNRRALAKVLARHGVALLVGTGLGALCHFLPDSYQLPCHVLAQICEFVFRGG